MSKPYKFGAIFAYSIVLGVLALFFGPLFQLLFVPAVAFALYWHSAKMENLQRRLTEIESRMQK